MPSSTCKLSSVSLNLLLPYVVLRYENKYLRKHTLIYTQIYIRTCIRPPPLVNLNFLRPYFMPPPYEALLKYYIFFVHFLLHNFWNFCAVWDCKFCLTFRQSLKHQLILPKIQSPIHAPHPPHICPYGPATEHDLVFNGVCFEAGFPFCGKGFMTAFYGIRNTQMDEWDPLCLCMG